MPFSLTPRWVFQHYSEITPDWLRQQGITLLLSDLDFTLAAKKTRRPDQSLRYDRTRVEPGASAMRGSVS